MGGGAGETAPSHSTQPIAALPGTEDFLDPGTDPMDRGVPSVELGQRLDELRKIAAANILDYMKSTPEGDPYLDFSALTRDQGAVLAEVTVEDFVDGRGEDARAVKRVKFKLHDKLSALDKLGRHLGLFTEKQHQEGRGAQIRSARGPPRARRRLQEYNKS